MFKPYPKPKKIQKKKKECVTDNTYYKVYTRDNGCCRLCGTPYMLELHHIIYRSEDRSLINNIPNCIMLCTRCHKKVHSNKHKWQPYLLNMRR